MKALIISLLALLLSGPALAGRRPSVEKNLVIDQTRALPVIGGITSQMSLPVAQAITQLAAKSKAPIWLVISSPGGSVLAMGHILESMDMAKRSGVQINCLVAQSAMSAAFHIFSHCSQRYALRSAVLLWHPVKVAFMFAYFTADDLAYISGRLAVMEADLIADALRILPIDEDLYMHHYRRETMWAAPELAAQLPGWLTIVESVKGVPIFFPAKADGGGEDQKRKQATPNQSKFEFIWEVKHLPFMYNDRVSFDHEFYGKCTGTVLDYVTEEAYRVMAICSTDQSVTRFVWVLEKMLTKLPPSK